MRRAALVLGSVLLVVAVAFAIAVAWLRRGDPLAALPRDAPSALQVVEERREAWQGRTLVHLVLRGETVGRVRFSVSLPDPLPAGRVPLVVVLGGLRTGSKSIREISKVVGDPGPNAFVGYDWPLPTRVTVGEVLRTVPQLRRDVLSVPGQVDAIVAWAAQRSWADPERVTLLGFSLGALVAPASQRLMQERGARVRWTALAYGGAPIGAVIAGHPKAGPAWLRPALGRGAELLLRPLEPSVHLPHLRGRFLVMGAASDHLVARAAAERMAELTPEPRSVVRIEGDHMGIGPERAKLLARVVAETRAWLLREGAIDPPREGGSVAR
jgi:dienelactone hydrolase